MHLLLHNPRIDEVQVKWKIHRAGYTYCYILWESCYIDLACCVLGMVMTQICGAVVQTRRAICQEHVRVN
jgi:hypothetical protein